MRQNEIETMECPCGASISPGKQQQRWFRHMYEAHPETWAQVPDSPTKAALAVKFNGDLERKVAKFPNVGRKRMAQGGA